MNLNVSFSECVTLDITFLLGVELLFPKNDTKFNISSQGNNILSH